MFLESSERELSKSTRSLTKFIIVSEIGPFPAHYSYVNAISEDLVIFGLSVGNLLNPIENTKGFSVFNHSP